ncbi:hypothetical protein CMUS01_14967 [Colletotrichum musicola]|uniref:Uncharacterized protein n=1 Tax=Colletotrichum musicola TaxID=2175873 RepID=A0A8H6MP39_9PEZI|nr:hypothetical protein CMUS01_14967 [Colletotrichum musicola]
MCRRFPERWTRHGNTLEYLSARPVWPRPPPACDGCNPGPGSSHVTSFDPSPHLGAFGGGVSFPQVRGALAWRWAGVVVVPNKKVQRTHGSNSGGKEGGTSRRRRREQEEHLRQAAASGLTRTRRSMSMTQGETTTAFRRYYLPPGQTTTTRPPSLPPLHVDLLPVL